MGKNIRAYKHLINGEWVGSQHIIERMSPATGQAVATFANGTNNELEMAIDSARAAFDDGLWPKMSGNKRSQYLRRWADKISENKEQLIQIEVEETGKAIKYARGDIEGSIGLIEYAASLAQTVHGKSFSNFGDEYTGLTLREPVGVVGLIVPWNFPALIFCQKVPFALAAGCTVVVKPSEFTSGTALEMSKLAEEVGIPKGVINVVTGYGDPVGSGLVTSEKVDRVSFTGSTRTGKSVIRNSAETIKPVAVELGGKSAITVFADADIDDAVDGVVFGINFNQGEVCVSTSRLIIEESIADEFLQKLVTKVKNLKVGNPFSEETDLGSLIHQEHLNKVLEYIQFGQEDGATLLTGGKQIKVDGSSCYIEPTIFDHVQENHRIFQEEIFGPVLSVIRFNGVEDAIRKVNNTVYGLANSIWTKNINQALTMSKAIKSGTVWVNTIIDGPAQLPLGGYKASGFGKEMGEEGMEEFTQIKSINIFTGKRNHYFM
ncbi:aldehyde dehydrogenase family protein [Bacillus sp. FJAT-50079]|uniref:aldehyde dehydrogenase family protein n=1 Tax=Bacillus sp. FJAT-50079 TaxID=2833577 RepID=UPI001BC970EE|nr:aldehyde dehydrogenase family protein [Bacillus sp. FJAT-50079]MBS4207531.1 aldehyde dehydrogenase family protein [Bacillus sp. FJAT-50079]